MKRKHFALCAGALATACFSIGLTSLGHRLDPVSNRARHVDRFTVVEWTPPAKPLPGGGGSGDNHAKPVSSPVEVVRQA